MHASNTGAYAGDKSKKEAVVKMALLNVAERLQINQRQVGQIVGASEAKMSRIYHGNATLAYSSKEYELALILIRVFRSLDAIFGGNDENVALWFHHHNDHLESIPAELVTTVSGLVEVLNYLDAMRGRM